MAGKNYGQVNIFISRARHTIIDVFRLSYSDVGIPWSHRKGKSIVLFPIDLSVCDLFIYLKEEKKKILLLRSIGSLIGVSFRPIVE